MNPEQPRQKTHPKTHSKLKGVFVSSIKYTHLLFLSDRDFCDRINQNMPTKKKRYHHFKGNNLFPSEKVERKVIELLLQSKIPDNKHESSIAIEGWVKKI